MIRAWDEGVSWFSRRTVAPTELPVTVEYIYDQVLRGAGSGEDEFIEHAIRAFTQDAEEATQRALMPQTWQMVLNRFPREGWMRLERPPLIAVTSVAYYDDDNALQELAISPAGFAVVTHGRYRKATLRSLDGETFPSTYPRPDAVTVTYTAGYEDLEDPDMKLITTGIALAVGEFYKLRSLSVQGIQNTPALLQLQRFWKRVW